MLRRDFARLGASALGLAALGPRRFRSRLGPIGVQLYTVRTAMQQSVEDTLAHVARIGYREVEFAGYFGRTPRQIRTLLDQNHLRSPSVHVALDDLEGEKAAATIEAAHTIGHHYVTVAWTDEALRRDLAGWRRVAERFNAAGERLHRASLQFAYHNHDFEFHELEGRVPFEVLCESTDPRLVQIELDLFWIIHANGDPLAFFRRWPGRVPMVHVKDRTADDHMADVGAGAIDWHAIFAQRREAGIRHYFVEHDEPADPFASIEASYAYLSRLDV